jgi:hypothetical protein
VPRCVVLIPVAAGAVDGARLADLLEALAAHEPLARDVLIVDDEQPARSFAHPALRVRVIANPRRGQGIPTLGGTTAGTLAGLAWVAAEAPNAWVLRLDADALVIGPFVEAVERALVPGVGLLGSCHRTCNGNTRDVSAIAAEVRRHTRALWAWRRPPRRPWWVRPADPHIREVLSAATAAGYVPGEHCIAAGCVVSPALLTALAARGWLRKPRRWLGARLGDDMVLGAMTRACGLSLVDLHAVFGLTHRGLPDTPQGLVDRHFAIIHSVKNDPVWTEAEVREFFAAARGTDATTTEAVR